MQRNAFRASDVLAEMDAEAARSAERVRRYILEVAGPQALAQHDAAMEEVASGRHELRLRWASLTAAQRAVLRMMGQGSPRLLRSAEGAVRYRLAGAAQHDGTMIRAATVRALVGHRVLAWTGPGGDQDVRAELTKRGRDVLAMQRSVH